MSGSNSRTPTRTPRTPTKVRCRRENLSSLDEIPTKDITKSKSVGGTPKTRRMIQCSAVRRSCPEFSTAGSSQNHHFRRHSENRRNLECPVSPEIRRRSRSYSCLADPNITNNSAFLSDPNKTSTQGQNSLSKNIYKLWKNGQLCDVVINVGDTRFYVHRLVMAASCEHFARHADTAKQTIYEYDVPNVSPEVMDEVLNFFYTSNLKITSINIQELLEISQNLGIKRLLDMCVDFLMKINLNNAVRNRSIAQRYGLNEVISSIDKYVHEHFSALVTTSSFLQSAFQYIYDIISSDNLTKPNELQIFHACVTWIDFRRQERMKYAVALMSLIRFGLIPAHEIVARVEPVSFIFDIPECKEMLYNAFRHHALLDESKGSSRVSLASRSVPPNIKNLHGNHKMDASQVDKLDLGDQSSEVSDTSGTLTSMEYDVQSTGTAVETETMNDDKVVSGGTVDPIVSERHASQSTKGQSSRGISKYKAYADEIRPENLPPSPQTSSAKDNDHSHSRVARNRYNISNEKIVNERKVGDKRDKYVEILAQRLSSVSVNKRKVSREDLARFSDFSDPISKVCSNTDQKQKAEVTRVDNIHDNSATQKGSGLKGKVIIPKENTEISESPPSANKTASFDSVLHKYHEKISVGKYNSPVVFERPCKSPESTPSHQRGFRSIGKVTELSPIKSEPSPELQPPPQPRIIMVVGGAGAYNSNSQNDLVSNSVHQFDPELNTWRLRSRLPLPVHYCAVALLEGCVYVTGGRLLNTFDRVPIKDCYKYDIANDKWEKIASLRTARCRHAAVTLNGAIYVVGGEDCLGMSCHTVEIYNTGNNSWSFMDSMREARVGPAAAAHRGRLYVAGGMMDVDNKFLLNTMEVYDLRMREWAFRYPLPVAVSGASMVDIAGVLYLVGGCVMRDGEPLSLDSIFRYTDETDSWEGYKTLHVPRHDAVVVALDSKLYVIGGESSAAMGHALSNVECINVEKDEHVPGIAPLITPAYGISGCVFSPNKAN